MAQPSVIFIVCYLSAFQSISGARIATKDVEALLKLEANDTDLDFEEQSEDADKPDFTMPDFDALARIRPHMLEKQGLAEDVAEDACVNWRTGSWINGSWGARSGKAQAGIIKATWDEKKLGLKLPAFNKYAHNGNDTEMTFNEFHEMLSEVEGDPDWAGKPTAASPPENLQSESKVAAWLQRHYKYGNNFWNAYKSERVAKEFAKKPRTQADVELLASFATLDHDKDGYLTVVEAQPYLPIDPQGKYAVYDWGKTALLEKSDFASLDFPAHLTNNVLKLSSSGRGLSKEEYDALHLQGKLTDFVKLSKLPPNNGEKDESIQAQLRFYQLAPTFPSTKDRSKRKFKQNFNGEEVEIHIPTLEEVAGHKGRLELKADDIARWLKHEKGMKNSSWLSWTGLEQHASDLARDVLRWGDGSIPGTKANGAIQGHKAGDDAEWVDVAPRLALFVHLEQLDGDSDGDVDFSHAYPYLSPRDESLFDASLFQ